MNECLARLEKHTHPPSWDVPVPFMHLALRFIPEVGVYPSLFISPPLFPSPLPPTKIFPKPAAFKNNPSFRAQKPQVQLSKEAI